MVKSRTRARPSYNFGFVLNTDGMHIPTWHISNLQQPSLINNNNNINLPIYSLLIRSQRQPSEKKGILSVLKGNGPAKMFSPIFRQCPEIYQFSWDIDIDNRQRHYKKQQHKSRSFLLNKNLVLVSACNTVIPWPALIFFEWLRKVTIRSVFFLLGAVPAFLIERLFQLSNSHSLNYTI